MNKSIVNINFDKLNENDIIVFKKGKWVAVPGTVFLNGVVKLIDNLKKELEEEKINRQKQTDYLAQGLDDMNKRIDFILGEDEPEETENEEE